MSSGFQMIPVSEIKLFFFSHASKHTRYSFKCLIQISDDKTPTIITVKLKSGLHRPPSTVTFSLWSVFPSVCSVRLCGNLNPRPHQLRERHLEKLVLNFSEQLWHLRRRLRDPVCIFNEGTKERLRGRLCQRETVSCDSGSWRKPVL